MSSVALCHAYLCVKCETAPVLVVTQQGFLNYVRADWEDEGAGRRCHRPGCTEGNRDNSQKEHVTEENQD